MRDSYVGLILRSLSKFLGRTVTQLRVTVSPSFVEMTHIGLCHESSF